METMNRNINVVTLRFGNTLKPNEVQLFRGAVIASMDENNVLMHNHQDEGYRYSYPLVQYPLIGERPAVVCVGEATNLIGELQQIHHSELEIGKRVMKAVIEELSSQNVDIGDGDTVYHYHISNWLPLNEENHEKYIKIEDLAEKLQMLKKILVGNILSCLKGLGIKVEFPIVCTLSHLSDAKPVHYKGVELDSYEAEFSANVNLPCYISIGKNASLGHGRIEKK